MTRRRTLTEREVRLAARDGQRTLEVGNALVTPSARDAAKVLGVELVSGVGSRESAVGGRDSARGTRHSAAQAESTRPPSAGTRPSPALFRVAVGADHGGVALKDTIAARLRELGHAVEDLGTQGTEAVDYPDFAIAVARAVAERRADVGVMVDGAGIGSCMAANKVAGVRAAMCHDITTAVNAREHNNANVLTLGGGLIGPRLALAILETFLATPFAGGRHEKRVAKIDALDRRT